MSVVWFAGKKMEDIENEVLMEALRFYGGNRSATANSLGISPRTLENWLKRIDAQKEAVEIKLKAMENKRAAQIAMERGMLAVFSDNQEKEQEKNDAVASKLREKLNEKTKSVEKGKKDV